MRWNYLLLGLVAVVCLAEEQQRDALPLAEPCDEDACQLPSCRCSSTATPGNLAPRNTPQFVLLTFNAAVNVVNIETYRSLLYGRRNMNGCPIGVTFFINHEYTNYQLVNELYTQGFEIGLHSITAQTPSTYWAEASTETLMQEFSDQRLQMSIFANIPRNSINGMRLPFMQMAGNNSFEMMAMADLTYDFTWASTSFLNPGLWPYTLHYESIQDCMVQECPTASIPGPWVLPITAWIDLGNTACSVVEACFTIPPFTDEEAWFTFMMTNFERHYLGSRAPFSFNIQESFISSHPAVRNAFIRFLDLMNNLNDVFMVNAGEVIDWVKNPTPITEYASQACRQITQVPCWSTTCGPLNAAHTELDYWLTLCSSCPRTYPWLGNPLGM